MSSQDSLGICVPGPLVLPVVEAQSRETDGPAQRASKLHAMQKDLQSIQIRASRGGKRAVFQLLYHLSLVLEVCKPIMNEHKLLYMEIFGILSSSFLEVLHSPVFCLHLCNTIYPWFVMFKRLCTKQ